MQNQTYHIFLADDDEDYRQFFMDAFTELPHAVKVTIFGNGVELMNGLLKSDNKLPHMIFLDLFMPLMNGEECLNDIRDEPKFSEIPIVIYSTALDIETAELLRRKVANLYLCKPSSFGQLKTALTQCIRFAEGTGKDAEDMVDFIVQY